MLNKTHNKENQHGLRYRFAGNLRR